MKNISLNITVEDDNISMNLEGEWSFVDFMTVMLSTLDGQVQQFIEEVKNEADEDTTQQVKCSVYDELNFLFGQMLERIIPDGSEDFDANLTAEAILRAENEIIKEKYDEVMENAETEN